VKEHTTESGKFVRTEGWKRRKGTGTGCKVSIDQLTSIILNFQSPMAFECHSSLHNANKKYNTIPSSAVAVLTNADLMVCWHYEEVIKSVFFQIGLTGSVQQWFWTYTWSADSQYVRNNVRIHGPQHRLRLLSNAVTAGVSSWPQALSDLSSAIDSRGLCCHLYGGDTLICGFSCQQATAKLIASQNPCPTASTMCWLIVWLYVHSIQAVAGRYVYCNPYQLNKQ